MDFHQSTARLSRTNLALAGLFLGAFVLGSSELIVVGVINLVVADLQVSTPAAGALVTAYALGLALGGPILTALTIRLNRRSILVGSLVLFALGNLVPVVTRDYSLFMASRAFTGSLQGLYVAAAFVAGGAIVAPGQMGRAISVVIAGFAISATVGVPIGTLVGQAFGWRGSFVAVVALSVVTLIANAVLVPSVPSTQGAGIGAKHAFAPRVLAILVLNFLVFASLYSTLTYIVPFLEGVTGISGTFITVFLLVYGVATAVGSWVGGQFADKNATRTLTLATMGTAVSLLVLYLVGEVAILVMLSLLALGVFAFGMLPSLQYRVVNLAGPSGALASSLAPAAANLGIAFGSVAGGLSIGSSAATSAVTTGLLIALVAVPVAWATGFLRPPVVQETPTHGPGSAPPIGPD